MVLDDDFTGHLKASLLGPILKELPRFFIASQSMKVAREKVCRSPTTSLALLDWRREVSTSCLQ